jgi:phosphate transport system permease protein
MSVDTEKRDTAPTPAPAGEVRPSRQLPRWTPPALLAGTAAVVGGLLALVGFSTALFVVATAVVFALALYLLSRSVEGPRKALDRLVTVIVTAAFLLALVPLVSLVITVIGNGVARLDAELFNSSMRGIVGEGGGIYHAIMGTLIITALASLMSIPIGLLTAIYLVEYGRGRLARAITFFVDVMTGIPSIVAGLFAAALFAQLLGPGTRFGFIGAVALSVLMIPVVVRATEEMLKIVPNELREAAFALGVPRWRTIVKVVIPTAVAGIASGVTLAIARVIGETAPLLVTVGLTTGVNLNPFSGQMATLPVFAYRSYSSPGVPPGPGIDRAWAAALVLIIIVMLLNLLARLVARLFAPKTR